MKFTHPSAPFDHNNKKTIKKLIPTINRYNNLNVEETTQTTDTAEEKREKDHKITSNYFEWSFEGTPRIDEET